MKRIDIDSCKLYKGCILASIAHAVAVSKFPNLDFEHSWDGINYSMNDGQGCRATITFHPKAIIAVFQNLESLNTSKEFNFYFEGASEEIKEIATNEALQYVLDNVDGKIKPVITGAFWGGWDSLFSNQILEEIIRAGGYILNYQLMDYEKALTAWSNNYELDAEQIALVDKLYKMKISSKTETITLTEMEIKCLTGNLEECRTSLNELNIHC